MNNPYYYKGANPTADLIILNPLNEILLIKRAKNVLACPEQWALPGGFVDSEKSKKGDFWIQDLEIPEVAAFRELKEETNLKLPNDYPLFFVGIYEGNNRDPRDNSISWAKAHAYYTQVDETIYNEQKDFIRGCDDADDAKWVKLDAIDYDNLAFDHAKIIQDGLKKYFYNNMSNKIKYK